MEGFKELSSLHGIQGAINVVKIHIQKSMHIFASDYYPLKSKAYNMQMQDTIDHRKRFLDVFVGMSSSINNAKMLWLSSVYKKATQGYLFNENILHEGIRPYIIDDKGYLFLPWLMVLHQQMGVHHYVFQAFFNKRLNHARVVVENNFKILKKTFWELLNKSNLNVHFLPNVVVCCCMLHNMILNGKDFNIDELMQ